jgi:ABC-type multidrug transport system ATPase subunit
MKFQEQILKRPSSEYKLSVRDLTLTAGQRIALLGENGSGKSTLIESLFNQEIIQSGRYVGTDIGDLNKIEKDFLKNQFAFVLSHFPSALALSVREVLEINYTTIDWPKALVMLEDFSLIKKLDLPFSHLSDGQKKLAMLIKSLCSDKKIFILDEPTTYLDSKNSRKIGHYLTDVIRKTNKKLLFTSHDFGFCLDFSDAVYWIECKDNPAIAGPKTIEDYILDNLDNQNIIISTEKNPFMNFMDEKLDVDYLCVKLFKSLLAKKNIELLKCLQSENFKIIQPDRALKNFQFITNGKCLIEANTIAAIVEFLSSYYSRTTKS